MLQDIFRDATVEFDIRRLLNYLKSSAVNVKVSHQSFSVKMRSFFDIILNQRTWISVFSSLKRWVCSSGKSSMTNGFLKVLSVICSTYVLNNTQLMQVQACFLKVEDQIQAGFLSFLKCPGQNSAARLLVLTEPSKLVRAEPFKRNLDQYNFVFVTYNMELP